MVLIVLELRVCRVCEIEKSLESFQLHNPERGWRRKVCNECLSQRNKQRREERKLGLRPIKQVFEKWCYGCHLIKNIDLFCRAFGEVDGYGSLCKECKQEQSRKHYQKHPEKYIQKGREWRENNLERYREITREWSRNKRDLDPEFKLRGNISRQINTMLKRKNANKNNTSILKFLPYTPFELRSHLETQFKQEWSWENYGIVWEIDHIIPQSKLLYDSLDHPNFLKCWGLENLRPLLICDNRKKGSK